MKHTIVVLTCVFGFTLAVGVTAQPEKPATPQADNISSPTSSLGLVDAVHVAEAYLKENKIDTSRHYLNNVRLQYGSSWMKGKHWIVTWKLKVMTDGGEIFVFVDMDKNAKTTYGE